MDVLVFSAGSKVCGLSLRDVREIMRPRPIASHATLPAFVLGISMIRDQPTPVVDMGGLLGGASSGNVTRFVSLRVENRHVALAVESVWGVKRVDEQQFWAATPLLCGAQAVVQALTVLDVQLVYVLNTARLLPDEVAEVGPLSRATLEETSS